jgi:hypothetical protein
VTGHRQLRLRPFDATRDTLTNYPVFDERLLALSERLAAAGYQHHQLQAFCRLLTAICRVGLRMTWDRDYRRGTHVTERKFHDDLHQRLLTEPELDGRLERGSPLALGYLDVRHDGITAELKIERKTPVTEETAPKYIGTADAIRGRRRRPVIDSHNPRHEPQGVTNRHSRELPIHTRAATATD